MRSRDPGFFATGVHAHMERPRHSKVHDGRAVAWGQGRCGLIVGGRQRVVGNSARPRRF